MTNTEELRIEMLKKSISSKSLALELRISENSFSRKLHNQNEFKASEIRAISNILELSDQRTAQIFLTEV